MADEANIQAWLAALDSDDLDTRLDAIHRLGEAKAGEAVPKLIALLDDADFEVCMAAVDALGQIGDDRAIPPLATIAQGEAGPLQSQAATALFAIHTPAALAAIEHLRDGDGYALGAAEPEPGALDDILLDKQLAEESGAEPVDEEESEPPRRRAIAPLPPPAPAPAPPPASSPAPTTRPPEPSPALAGDVSRSLEEAVNKAQEVQFSAYYPREIRPNEWQPLQAYVFKKLAERRVAEDAEKTLGPLDAFRRIVERARHVITEGEMITATPTLPGFQFNPPLVTIGFYEDWHRLSFKMRAADAPLNQAANGVLTFTAGGIIVADVPLSVFVTHEVARSQLQASETRPMYDTVFASYSHRDTRIVERVEAAAKTMGMTYLRDVITLRSGEDWNQRLMEMIEEATIFQLFWSAESARSPHCRLEWEHALKLDRQATRFVRPVYWSQPMPAPPPPLQHLHFAYMPDLVN